MVGIIDYGVGNLSSVKNALDKIGVEAMICSTYEEILKMDRVILPGVGAFGDAIKTLKNRDLDKAVFDFIKTKKPILGICVGMQMLLDKSYEFGLHDGLGLIKGEVIKFKEDGIHQIPHVGFNDIMIDKNNKLFKNIKDNSSVYFIHSYHAANVVDCIAKTNYIYDICVAVNKDNIYGVQFHPEKSGEVGLQILRNFCEL